jgi:peptidoglycan/LPS O-acetylase OafA/YrhL
LSPRPPQGYWLARVLPRHNLRPSRLVHFLDWRVLVAAGLASYSIFLWNFPAMHLAQSRKRAVARPARLMVETTPALRGSELLSDAPRMSGSM